MRSSFLRHGSANNDLDRLKNYEEFLDSTLIRLESIESNTLQHFPHWRGSIFNFQCSQWLEATQMNNSLEQVTVDLSVGDNTLWQERNAFNFMAAIGAIPTLNRLNLRQSNLGSPLYFLPAITSAVECARCLTCLEIQWKRIDKNVDKELNALAKTIGRSKNLQTLSIKGGQSTVSTVQALLPVLENKNLKKLCFGNVTSETVQPFLDSLSDNNTLHKLKISFASRIEDNICENIADILIGNKTLQSLSLLRDGYRTQESFTSKSQQALVRLAEQNHHLQEINIAGPANASVDFFVNLNRAGRHKLFHEGSTRKDWMDVMAGVSEDVESLFYLLLLNPSLCDVV